MYYVLITDNDGNENRLKARTWDEVLLFVRVHKGKIREFKFKRKWEINDRNWETKRKIKRSICVLWS